MPHFRIEYSANLDGRLDIRAFCGAMHRAILATGLFEVGAVRVRTFRADDYAIADILPENGFIDMSFRVGEGRKLEDLRGAGEAIFKAAQTELSKLLSTPHFALSFSIEEIDSRLSWKDNTMHQRLRIG